MSQLSFGMTRQDGARIRVVGVGGGGGNAVNSMIENGLEGVDFIVANTDLQALAANNAPNKLQLGEKLTRGLGAGANPEIGWKAAHEDQSRIAEALEGSDMVFITAGMGGGTGTGAAPVIAQVAREIGALAVGVVTKPFDFEGRQRLRKADEGIRNLKESVDTLIVIPNQRLLSIASENMSLLDSFRRADDVLLNAVRGISDLITTPGLINVDFADVKTIMSNMGMALMGTGVGRGEKRAIEAAKAAIASPLLEDAAMDGATGLLINITAGPDLTLYEINEATSLIQEAAHDDANIIFGTVINETMREQVTITVVATGFDRVRQQFDNAMITGYADQQQVGQAQGQYAGVPQSSAYIAPNRVVQSTPAPQVSTPAPQQPAQAEAARQVAPSQSSSQPRINPQVALNDPGLDRPAYMRDAQRGRQIPAGAAEPGPQHQQLDPDQQNPFLESDHSEFDTPTFLRR
jgi:cell division protein FtsZ